MFNLLSKLVIVDRIAVLIRQFGQAARYARTFVPLFSLSFGHISSLSKSEISNDRQRDQRYRSNPTMPRCKAASIFARADFVNVHRIKLLFPSSNGVSFSSQIPSQFDLHLGRRLKRHWI